MASEPISSSPRILDRVGWLIFLPLVAVSLVAGWQAVTQFVVTRVPLLLFPAAAGLPDLVPPLRLWPVGRMTVAVWGIDVVGAVVMLVAAVVWLRAAAVRHPDASRLRAFGRAVAVCTLVVVIGNVVRLVPMTFIMHSDAATFGGQFAATVVVSAVWGALIGVVVGVLAAVGAKKRAAAR
ncbi:hypothetical protein [Microbacterium sp. YY-01]|uniref:hypothetical protein n=1 Tax=Microbacterium sp. YY-01 TaxID=3421634 RepID=UPI003D18325E